MPITTAFFMRCCKRLEVLLRVWLVCLACLAGLAQAGNIEPTEAALLPGEDGYTLSAEFSIDLGTRLADVVAHGVPLYFKLECLVERPRKYWVSEHIATRSADYKLSYSSLTRQYRITSGSLHRNFDSLEAAVRSLSRVGSLLVTERNALKSGEGYEVAVRLSLDRSQLPKPFQIDAITDRDWQVEASTRRWKFVVP
jgi:hypothetical protein